MRGWPPRSSARERHSPSETFNTWSKERHEAQLTHSGARRADHAVAREGEAACERDTGIKNHTVVLEVVPRTTTTHTGVEGVSGPCRGRVPKTEDSPQGLCNTLL